MSSIGGDDDVDDVGSFFCPLGCIFLGTNERVCNWFIKVIRLSNVAKNVDELRVVELLLALWRAPFHQRTPSSADDR